MLKLDVRRSQSAYVGGCKLEGYTGTGAMRCAKVTACADVERRQKQEHLCKSRQVCLGKCFRCTKMSSKIIFCCRIQRH